MNFNEQFYSKERTKMETLKFNDDSSLIMGASLNIRYILSYSDTIYNFLHNLSIEGIYASYSDNIFVFKMIDRLTSKSITFTNLDVFALLEDDFWTTKSLITNMGYNLNPERKMAAGR